jgi:hypothetical protein
MKIFLNFNFQTDKQLSSIVDGVKKNSLGIGHIRAQNMTFHYSLKRMSQITQLNVPSQSELFLSRSKLFSKNYCGKKNSHDKNSLNCQANQRQFNCVLS